MSSDVVGYAQAGTTANGFKAMSATSFAGIGGTLDLQDITVAGYDSESGFEGDVYVETLDANGKATGIYSWVDVPKDEEDPDSVAFYGWYDGEELVENLTVTPGMGLWTHSDSAAYSLQSAGKVLSSSAAVSLTANGFALVGNPMPVAHDLQDLTVGGYDTESGFEGDVYVETLGPTGKATGIYSWVDVPKDDEDPDSVAFYGWYDGEELVENLTIAAGEALWCHSDSATYTLVFPSAL